jgi:putative FmdB family regulatory protein
MPTYQYKCAADDEIFDLVHSMADCDVPHYCRCGAPARRVIASVEAFFWGPDFSSGSQVARANVGRNPSNQTRYSR